MGKAISKEFLISEFWRYFNEFGKYPFMKELVTTKGYPSDSGYKRIWGSWDNFLKEIGVVRKDCPDGWYITDENVLKEKYYDGNKQDIINSLMIKRQWGYIVKKANSLGLDRNKSVAHREFSNDELINKLKEFAHKLGKTPSDTDVRKYKEIPSTKTYTKRFGSWNNALKIAGLSLNAEFNISKEEIINRAKEFYKNNNRSPYWNELGISRTVYENYWEKFTDMLEEIDLPLNKKTRNDHFKSDEELINDYKILFEILGRIPIAKDVNNHRDMASFETYVKRIGGYKQLWERCGISNETILDQNKYGFICLDKNGDICKSYAEMVITNLFIDNNIKYIKEYPYRKLIPNFKGKSYVLDWYLPEYTFCVEYFGIYREKQLNSQNEMGDYSRKAEKKKKLLKENDFILIDLYQEDLNETYLQRLIKKFNSYGINIEVNAKNLYKNRDNEVI